MACEDIYTTEFGMSADSALSLCSSAGNFTFTSDDYFPTCVALTTVYLYQDGYNAYYFDEFIALSGIASEDINTYLYGADQPFTQYYQTI
jgi:hypothetical protein